MQKITLDYVLDRIKERHSLKSDYAVCKHTGIGMTVLSNWRNGRSLPDERMCQILADAAGIDPLVLAASMQSQRSKTEEARSLWAMVAERLQMASPGVAAALIATAGATAFVADDVYASSVSDQPGFTQAAVDKLYIVYLLQLFMQQCLRTLDGLFSDGDLCLQP
jgi:transcriptional regulator with XRE-family HTH domain